MLGLSVIDTEEDELVAELLLEDAPVPVELVTKVVLELNWSVEVLLEGLLRL